MLTIPSFVLKSSTIDLFFPIFGIVIQPTLIRPCVVTERGNLMMLGPEPYSYSLYIGKSEYRRFPAWILT